MNILQLDRRSKKVYLAFQTLYVVELLTFILRVITHSQTSINFHDFQKLLIYFLTIFDFNEIINLFIKRVFYFYYIYSPSLGVILVRCQFKVRKL